MKSRAYRILSFILALTAVTGAALTLFPTKRAIPENPIRDTALLLSAEPFSGGSGVLRMGNTQAEHDEPNSEQSKEQNAPTEERVTPSDTDKSAEMAGDTPTNSFSEANSGGEQSSASNPPTESVPDAEQNPRIVTDLTSRSIVPAELEEDWLEFHAYPTGGEALSLKVYIKESASGANNGTLLTPDAQGRYRVRLERNTSYTVTMYLYQEGKRIGDAAHFYLSYRPELASESQPETGDHPPAIRTSRDGKTDVLKQQRFTLEVTARTWKNEPIPASHIILSLDGQVQNNPTGSAERLEYALFLTPGAGGEEICHVLEILAWDDDGNSSYRRILLPFCAAAEDEAIGSATVRLDATTVGLGVIDSGSYDIVQGETAADALLHMLDDCGFTADYSGTPDGEIGFYLRRIYRGDLMYGSSIDERLRTLLLRDGFSLTAPSDSDSLGEYDFSTGAGWMYDINGGYSGKSLSEWTLNDGDVLTLRFTLAWGKDIGGYGGGYGTLTSYCGIWRDGCYFPLEHDYAETDRVEPTQSEGGYVEFTCGKCGEVQRQALPATGTEPTEPADPIEAPADPVHPTEPTALITIRKQQRSS